MKMLLVACLVVLAGCSAPEPAGVKAIVGAKLQASAQAAPIEYSVVVVADGKITAAGAQATTPVPKGAEITSGKGKIVEPAPGGSIEPGKPADLVLRDAASLSVESTMHNGEWVK
jgi:imidazolonepropionase-like amidohydrolase